MTVPNLDNVDEYRSLTDAIQQARSTGLTRAYDNVNAVLNPREVRDGFAQLVSAGINTTVANNQRINALYASIRDEGAVTSAHVSEALGIFEDQMANPWQPERDHQAVASRLDSMLGTGAQFNIASGVTSRDGDDLTWMQDTIRELHANPSMPVPTNDDLRTELEALWIEHTVSTRALLSHGHANEVRELLDEVDTNLRAFDDGEVPPDSDELKGVIFDAVTRAAIPYQESPLSMEETTRQLRNVGLDIPDLDLKNIGARTGIRPLTTEEVTKALDVPDSGTAPEVTLYTTPECMACMATKRTLDKAGVEYENIDLTEHPELVETFKSRGLQRAPIVEADGDRWAGHNPSKLQEHGLDYRTRQQRAAGTGTESGVER